MSRPATSITMYPWKPPQSFFPTLDTSQGGSSTSSAPVSGPSKADKRSAGRGDNKRTEERRRLPRQARDVLIKYFDDHTEYPSQRQKHDLLALIRSIPGAEWYTEEKLAIWFINRRAYQRKREDEEEEEAEPVVRPERHGPGRPKGSRNKEPVHVMSSSNILWPTLDEIKICKLMILYRENPEPNEQILEVWSRALKAEKDDVHNWVQMSRVEGGLLVKPIINSTSSRVVVRDGISTLPLSRKLMAKNNLIQPWTLKARPSISDRVHRYFPGSQKSRPPPYVHMKDDCSVSCSPPPSPISKSPTPADKPPVVSPLLSTQETSKTVRHDTHVRDIAELSTTLPHSLSPSISSATLDETKGPFPQAEPPTSSSHEIHEGLPPPRRNLLAELAVFVDEKLSSVDCDANISNISVEEFKDSWRASEAFFEKIKSGAYSSQGLVFRVPVGDDES